MCMSRWTLMCLIQCKFGGKDAIIVHEHGDADAMRIFISTYKAPAVIGNLSFHERYFIRFRARIHK